MKRATPAREPLDSAKLRFWLLVLDVMIWTGLCCRWPWLWDAAVGRASAVEGWGEGAVLGEAPPW